jgi:heme exporter protein C
MTAAAPVRTPTTLLAFVAFAGLLVLGALYTVAAVAPPDVTLGIVQKIFYFHVGSAFAMLLCLTGGSVASLVDLVQTSDRIDALARSLIDTGILFALMVLTSGPLWARKSWGAWWTWEPRLTLTLLVLLLAVGVLAVRSMAPHAATGRRIGAAVATLAAPTSYLIHVAVQKWGGTHPQVIQGGGIQNSEMRIAFWTSVAALLLFAGVLAAVRYRVLRLEKAVQTLRLEKSADALRHARGAAAAAAAGV